MVVACRAVRLVRVDVRTGPAVVIQDWPGWRRTADWTVRVVPGRVEVTASETVLPAELVVTCWSTVVESGRVVTCWTTVVDGMSASGDATWAVVLKVLVTTFFTVVAFPSMVVWMPIVDVTVARDRYAEVAVEKTRLQSKQMEVDVAAGLGTDTAFSTVWCSPLLVADSWASGVWVSDVWLSRVCVGLGRVVSMEVELDGVDDSMVVVLSSCLVVCSTGVVVTTAGRLDETVELTTADGLEDVATDALEDDSTDGLDDEATDVDDDATDGVDDDATDGFDDTSDVDAGSATVSGSDGIFEVASAVALCTRGERRGNCLSEMERPSL
jgi:hypothetical protein